MATKKPKTAAVAAQAPTEFAAYILRSCEPNLTSWGGFQWPESGHVAAPDWNPEAICGYGLHGFLWGEGDGSLASFQSDAKWVVAGINEWVELNGKVKAPEAWVLFVGDRHAAAAHIISLGAKGAVVSGTATAGVSGTATAGDSGTATAGVSGIIVIRYFDYASARYRLVEGYVGENGIEANVPYCVRDGKLVQA